MLASGCSTGSPAPIKGDALAEAQTFPYFRVYWVGPTFGQYHLSAADGLRGYKSNVGAAVYYGECVHYKGIFGGGSCLLPLQVTTVVYRLHSNATLGPQRNTIVREKTAAELLAALNDRMEVNIKKPGAVEFAQIFDEVARR